MARTVITNTAGEAKHFGFLPPHGKDLSDGETLTIDGDLRTLLAGGLNRFGRKSAIAALDRAVGDGLVAVEDIADPSSSSSSS
jgi:hypothetical protein